MLQSLEIKDFQSHKNTLIEFDPRVTAIIGLNSHGKSAILKALNKAIRNNPSGNSFIRNIPDIAKASKLTVVTDKGKIERIVGRGDSAEDNIYNVITKSGEEFKYTKFSKTGIPKEVVDVSEISLPQLFGNEEYDLNFQKQRDDIFLVTGKGLASIRSKVLSKITGIDVAQRAIQIGRLKERNINQEIEKNRNERERLKIELSNYDVLNEIKIKVENQKNIIKRLLKLENDIEYYTHSFKLLSNIINKALSLRNFIKTLDRPFDIKTIEETKSKLLLLYKLYDVIINENQLSYRINLLSKKIEVSHLENLFYKKSLLERFQVIKKKLEDLTSLSNAVNIDLIDLKSVSEVKEKLINFISLNKNLERSKILKDSKEKEIETVNENYLSSLETLKDLKCKLKVCPTCNRPFEEAV